MAGFVIESEHAEFLTTRRRASNVAHLAPASPLKVHEICRVADQGCGYSPVSFLVTSTIILLTVSVGKTQILFRY